MKSNLQTSFTVDKENNRIHVERTFAAPLKYVWAAWTQSELLDQWWAPSPWKAETKSMDFRPGGYWLYAMVSPEGEKHYGRADFESITPEREFIARDCFCDEEGVPDNNLPCNKWHITFHDQGDSTMVKAKLSFDTLKDLETIVAMGFQEGFAAAHENLDRYLAIQFPASN
jgi:uncharacterized protein YndB with AHSA1/START domain